MARWNQSRIGSAPGAVSPASARTLSPPSVSSVTAGLPGRPWLCRTAPSRRSGWSSWLADQAEIPAFTPRGQGLADHDLEVAFLVMPVADVAAVEADDD